jgi:hypothetical protein
MNTKKSLTQNTFKLVVLIGFICLGFVGASKAAHSKLMIEANDTLATISFKVYGTHKHWHKIYLANKDQIANPNLIYKGSVIDIPALNGNEPPKIETANVNPEGEKAAEPKLVFKAMEDAEKPAVAEAKGEADLKSSKPKAEIKDSEAEMTRNPTSTPAPPPLKAFVEMELPEL